MPFRIIRNDITKMNTDAIVNTANPFPVIGAGTDSAIYEAAGADLLLKEREKIGCIERGEAAITPGFHLNAKYIIHTVGPVWMGGDRNEEYLLRSCYKNSLLLARKYNCESIAFPFISTGVYGFPKDKALRIVVDTISDFLIHEEMMIYLVVYDKESTRLSEHLFDNIESLIDDSDDQPSKIGLCSYADYDAICEEPPIWSRNRVESSIAGSSQEKFSKRKIEDLVKQKSETFQQMLLRLIDEKGMTNSQVYKKANQDKKLFSKIKNDENYQPKKKTAIAFALALELNMDQTKDLLSRAGYAFSPSSNFDRVIQYCIETQEYNIIEIEFILYDLGLDTLCNY